MFKPFIQASARNMYTDVMVFFVVSNHIRNLLLGSLFSWTQKILVFFKL